MCFMSSDLFQFKQKYRTKQKTKSPWGGRDVGVFQNLNQWIFVIVQLLNSFLSLSFFLSIQVSMCVCCVCVCAHAFWYMCKCVDMHIEAGGPQRSFLRCYVPFFFCPRSWGPTQSLACLLVKCFTAEPIPHTLLSTVLLLLAFILPYKNVYVFYMYMCEAKHFNIWTKRQAWFLLKFIH